MIADFLLHEHNGYPDHRKVHELNRYEVRCPVIYCIPGCPPCYHFCVDHLHFLPRYHTLSAAWHMELRGCVTRSQDLTLHDMLEILPSYIVQLTVYAHVALTSCGLVIRVVVQAVFYRQRFSTPCPRVDRYVLGTSLGNMR